MCTTRVPCTLLAGAIEWGWGLSIAHLEAVLASSLLNQKKNHGFRTFALIFYFVHSHVVEKVSLK